MSAGAYIEQITLHHMNMDINIERLVMERRQGDEQLLAIWIIQRYYIGIVEKLGDDATKYYKRRALDHAKFFAIQRLPELKSLTDASFIYLIDEAKRTGWFHSDHIGYDSLDELLTSIVDSDSVSEGELSDWKFMANQLMPAAKQFGISPDELLAATCQVKKLRGAVPTCRQILYELEMGDKEVDEAEEEIKSVVKWVADPKITFRQFETNLGKREPPEVYRAIDVYEISL
ncbi:MAG: hypothetical protein ACXABN_18205, partial [Candidatus Thorarchaeota archaeon]